MSKEISNAALEILNVNDVTVEIFFVQRKAKQLDKKKGFAYTITKIDVDKEINDFFLDAARLYVLDLEKPAQPVRYLDYAVITDDLPNVCLTYADADSLSVSDKIWKKIDSKTDINRTSKLSDIKDDLWYYCASFIDTHEIGDPRLLFFRKTSSSAVATDSIKGLKNRIRAQLSTSDPKLVKITDETISFDNTFDCMLFGNDFLIKEKQRFEKIAEIEEEFVEHSRAAIRNFEKMDIIEGLDFLEVEITGKPSMMRILANIVKNENHGEISESKISSMRKTLLENEGRKLNMTADGKKLLIQDKEDAKDLLNLLNDYYKQGMTSGKTYGSNAGRIIKKKKT